jgi:hypothetical protein
MSKVSNRKHFFKRLLKMSQNAGIQEGIPQQTKEDAIKAFDQIAQQTAEEITNQIDSLIDRELAG